MGTAIATMAKRDKLDSIDIVSPFPLHAYDDEDEREDRDADDEEADITDDEGDADLLAGIVPPQPGAEGAINT